jgi:formate dehydrogenase subunit gamma
VNNIVWRYVLQDTNKSGKRTVKRYRKRAIVLHWLHAAAFLILVLTGAVTFFRGDGFSNFYIAKILHRAAAILFIGIPVLNCLLDLGASMDFIKETFRWGRDDTRWLLAAPDYYFGGAEERMPAQGRLNAGQKAWQAIIIITGLIFVVTGIALWGFRWALPLPAYQWLLFTHGVAFVVVVLMFMVHIYLGVFHPRFRESLRSMLDGRISPDYANRHYRKWYERQTGNKEN